MVCDTFPMAAATDLCCAYKKDRKVWLFFDPSRKSSEGMNIWEKAVLLHDIDSNSRAVLCMVESDGREVRLELKSTSDLPHLRNPEYLIGDNDLTSLSYLHPPAVLYNLEFRFKKHTIYTYCGIVLVALNPYCNVTEQQYEEIIMQRYKGKNVRDPNQDPHVFAVAEEAFSDMAKFKKNQSIIVSGESGAGKTVSAKYAMRYFAYVCASVIGSPTRVHKVEERVLASNIIMETFGNARTIKNDNSSRFGKFIQIHFTERCQIAGAKMRTYLLEKSRVVQQARTERNYHIFYQLCTLAQNPNFAELQLDDASKFFYINNQWLPTDPEYANKDGLIISGVDDAVTLKETFTAMDMLAFADCDKSNIIYVLAALLHLGQISFEDLNGDSCRVKPDCAKELRVFESLLQLAQGDLARWLTNRPVAAAKECLTTPLTQQQALVSRDALAKRIYSGLFDWIVAKINDSMRAQSASEQFIGVLDIYGFEMFESNSFEQFCINYANEKLQYYFNQHVFKLQQDEYKAEQIKWDDIHFFDNSPCINLIEEKRLGILALLDEQCMVPQGNDYSWLQKMENSFKKDASFNQCFSVPKLAHESRFIVSHFAAVVTYDVENFVEKNRDQMNEALLNVLRNSQNPFVQKLVEEHHDGVAAGNGKPQPKSRATLPRSSAQQPRALSFQDGASSTLPGKFRKSVARQFRDSLDELVVTLNSTTPHYIRCIKPNEQKAEFKFDWKHVAEQLKACGVLETVRISAAGYPSKWSYEEFYQRYQFLLPLRLTRRGAIRENAEAICREHIRDSTKFACGRTKLFFRTGEVARLENLLIERKRAMHVMVVKRVRGYLARKRYLRIRGAVLTLQQTFRAFLAWRRLHYLRMHRAAVTIQTNWRMHFARKRFLALRRTALVLQCHARGRRERRKLMKMRFEQKARVIQRFYRGWVARREYKRKLRSIVVVQCCVRKWLAKRELKRLKIEARSVQHVQQLNKGLEIKIMNLQYKINALTQEKASLESKCADADELRARLKLLENVAQELEHALREKRSLEAAMAELNARLQTTQGQLQLATQEKAAMEKAWKDEVAKLSQSAKQVQAMQKVKDQTIESQDASLNTKRKEIDELRKQLDELEKWKSSFLTEQNNAASQNGSVRFDLAATRCASPNASASGDDEDVGDDGYSLSVPPTPHRLQNGCINRPGSPLHGALLEDVEARIDAGEHVNQVNLNLLRLAEYDKQQLKAQLDKALRTIGLQQNDVFQRSTGYLEMRCVDLESRNLKLKKDLDDFMRKTAPSEEDFYERYKRMESERETAQDELLLAQNLIRQHFLDYAMKLNGAAASSSSSVGVPELISAYQQQKQMLVELRQTLDDRDAKIQEKQREIDDLIRIQTDQNGSANAENGGSHNPQADFEIKRLVVENLRLREKLSTSEKKIKDLERRAQTDDELMEHVKNGRNMSDIQLDDRNNNSFVAASPSGFSAGGTPASLSLRKPQWAVSTPYSNSVRPKPTIKIQGMIDCSEQNYNGFIQTLLALRPSLAAHLQPSCLPAFLIYMSFRYADLRKDKPRLEACFNQAVANMREKILDNKGDLELTMLWLANMVKLLHLIRQFGGSDKYRPQNSSKQNEQCLHTFDMSTHAARLKGDIRTCFESLLGLLANQFEPVTAPAILQYDDPNLNGDFTDSTAMKALLTLMKQVHDQCGNAGLDFVMREDIFRAITRWINAHSLNELLMRKGCSTWSKGAQIGYQLTKVEHWCKDHGYAAVISELDRMRQVSALLQVNKRIDGIDFIIEMVPALTTAQVMKILDKFSGEEEMQFDDGFLDALRKRLEAERKDREGQDAVISPSASVKLQLTYVSATETLDSIEIPSILSSLSSFVRMV